jgi:hypothetical protein
MLKRKVSILAAGLIGLIVPVHAECRADERVSRPPASLNDLSMEVAALHILHQFQFTSEQLRYLRKLAAETSQEREIRPAPRTSEKYARLLFDLRDALIGGNEEKVDKIQQQLDTLRTSEPLDLDDGIDITEAARREAPRLLRLLSPKQIAFHLSYYGDQLPDPVATLENAIDTVRNLKDKEWKQLREEVAEQIGPLVVGLDIDKAGQVSDRAVQLLIEVRALSKEDFERRRSEFRKQAMSLIGNANAFDVLRHLVEQSLAELLSNPRLAFALDAQPQR